jgi:hypothetical protein
MGEVREIDLDVGIIVGWNLGFGIRKGKGGCKKG